jgi:ribosomal protein S18 acetylase RimI-like enzyme
MPGFEFPEAPEIETAYRTAYEALRAIASRPSIDSGHDLTVSGLIRQFGRVAEEAELAVAAQIGPLVSWRGPAPQQGTLEPTLAVVDLDGGDYSSGDIRLGRDAYEGIDSTWHGSALDYAGRAYKRECGWDFPPGDTGAWVLMLAPVQCAGDEDHPWSYAGHMTGFVILSDRDEDGSYEAVSHLWTASRWRRRGIAKQLLAEARSRFKFTEIEEPYSPDGDAFLKACGYVK